MKLLIPGLAVVFSTAVFGQAVTASVTGTVVDSGGGVVPNVRVRVVNTDRQIARETLTDDRGDYVVPSLLPGN